MKSTKTLLNCPALCEGQRRLTMRVLPLCGQGRDAQLSPPLKCILFLLRILRCIQCSSVESTPLNALQHSAKTLTIRRPCDFPSLPPDAKVDDMADSNRQTSRHVSVNCLRPCLAELCKARPSHRPQVYFPFYCKLSPSVILLIYTQVASDCLPSSFPDVHNHMAIPATPRFCSWDL